MLTADIAKQYGIKRSTSLGVINISIVDKSGNGVSAFIEGHAKNNLSQLKQLEFTKITEEHAIYYIATFNFVEAEHLNFNFYVVPDGESQRTMVTFVQQFFVG